MPEKVSPSMVRTIAGRLGAHAPFDRLDPASLEALAARLRIRYVRASEVVFSEGDVPAPEVYLVQKGQVCIQRKEGDEVRLVDVCDEGDMFGVRALLGNRNYAAEARAQEDGLLYVIPGDALESLTKSDVRVAMFFAADFAADVPVAKDNRLQAVADARRELLGSSGAEGARSVEANRDVVSCAPDTSIRAAAQAMKSRNVGSILVLDPDGLPLGILTDSDLRSKVVAEAYDVERPVRDVMNSPVVTVEDGVSEANLIATMMRRRLHHFAVTEDGTDRSPVQGVISEHDVFKTRGNHPTVILAEMRKASTKARLRRLRDQTEELLRQYLEAETSMDLVARVVSEINDALIRRSVELSLRAMEDAGSPRPKSFCWLALGSEGREEQLLRTDQDNAIVYADDGPSRASLELGARVVDFLVESGFERCPGGVMASNEAWNRSLSSWERQFDEWVAEPDSQATMRANICFDFRPVAGEFGIAHVLKNHVLEAVAADRSFLTFFARGAVQSPPPLSFFRSEIVERSGEHRSTFDIKARAMSPLADAARVLVYDLGFDMYGGTVDRWRRIAETEPTLKRLATEAGMAYQILMRSRAVEGLTRGNSGRYVHIKELNKLERQTLRSTFSVVEDVQLMLKSRYRLDLMR